jgi:protocatechuate 3,4-dioxygenase beta subunit
MKARASCDGWDLQNLTALRLLFRLTLGMEERAKRQTVLSRRGFLAGGVVLAGALRAMPSVPACVLTTEQEEGPYYVDYGNMRSDITEGKPGVPLRLKIALLHAKRCTPLPDAALDIWHCDAVGIYSGFTANHGGFGAGGPGADGPGGRGGRPAGPPPGPPPDGFGPPHGPRVVDATRFLRGVQSTDSNGMADFTTIYPGWYEGRTIHIHLKVHTGGHVSHTGQLFFPEDITARIAQMQPYTKHQDVHRTTQEEDHVFEDQHGAAGMVTLNRIEAKSDRAGFIATVTLAVDPDAVPQALGMGGGGFPPPPR